MTDSQGATSALPESVPQLIDDLRAEDYIADRGLATALYLSLKLGKPLLLEGEVGVGKTELARTLARMTGRQLIRLQCYEGIDTQQALYEWDYARQMLHVRALSARELNDSETTASLYGADFLLERPLLQAIRSGGNAVLLIDEIDRADDEFEAFLLELLSDFQITIPEIGTVAAAERPIVVLTSNRTRELHDALKRRCLYHWIGFPSIAEELDIVRLRVPDVADTLVEQVVNAVHQLRDMDLAKPPGIAETLDWVDALGVVGSDNLNIETAADTLGSVIKDRDDLELVHAELDRVVADG